MIIIEMGSKKEEETKLQKQNPLKKFKYLNNINSSVQSLILNSLTINLK